MWMTWTPSPVHVSWKPRMKLICFGAEGSEMSNTYTPPFWHRGSQNAPR